MFYRVMYRSAENGTMPFGDDAPLTSQHNRLIWLRKSVSSIPSTCIRAPSSMKAIARDTSSRLR